MLGLYFYFNFLVTITIAVVIPLVFSHALHLSFVLLIHRILLLVAMLGIVYFVAIIILLLFYYHRGAVAVAVAAVLCGCLCHGLWFWILGGWIFMCTPKKLSESKVKDMSERRNHTNLCCSRLKKCHLIIAYRVLWYSTTIVGGRYHSMSAARFSLRSSRSHRTKKFISYRSNPCIHNYSHSHQRPPPARLQPPCLAPPPAITNNKQWSPTMKQPQSN